MRLVRRPDLLDRLAAQYALGVLRGGARRRLEQMAREEPSVRAAISHWQARLAGVAELQASTEPVDKLWCGIEQRLGWKAAPEPSLPPQAWWQRLWAAPVFWRGATAAMAVVTVLAVGVGLQLAQQQAVPQVSTVAVLNDDRAQPALLVSWDAGARNLIVRRLDHLALTDRQVLQLWALPAGRKPQSLGVIGRAPEARLALAQFPDAIPALAVSIEPPGGSPNADGPSGPVVFKGPVIHNRL